MTDIMKLAAQWGDARIMATRDRATNDEVLQARDAMRSAIEALQSKLGDAIQSSAHWQHQFTEAQAENEKFRLLAKANSEALGAALAERDQLQAENDLLEIEVEDTKKDLRSQRDNYRNQRDALQAKLDAMAKGEPIYQYQMGDGSWIDQTKKSYDYNRNHAPNAVVRIAYAAPKALAPLTDDQLMDLHRDAYTNAKAFTTIEVYRYFARVIEAAHGIGGTP